MPELPEVEIVRLGLAAIFKDKQAIIALKTSGQSLRLPIPPDLGKGLSGTWRLTDGGDPRKHDHVSLNLEDGRRLA